MNKKMNDVERSIIQCQKTNEDWNNGGRDKAKLKALKLLLEEARKFGWGPGPIIKHKTGIITHIGEV